MFQHLNNILNHFSQCFNRKATWKNFVVIILGFMLRTNSRGVTSMVSSLRLEPKQYHVLLHFFRSSGYTICSLYEKWIEIAKRETSFTRIAGYIVLLGDHIKISKEARRMPDIQLIHQDSENSGKGEFIDGHTYAQVSAVISNNETSRSLALISEQQKSPPRKENSKEPDGDTLVTQMVNLAGKATKSLGDGEKAIVALDAYFSNASAFLAADKVVDEQGNRRLEIVTRARIDSVGFKTPEPRPKGKRGASRKYGDKVALQSLFSDTSQFTETTLKLYGKPTKIKYLRLDLIWKPLGEQRMIRFVLVDSDRGRMILMCSDLNVEPEDIITIYCLRFKIETGFGEQKNDMGCFAYHFWTSALPKRKRRSKNGRALVSESPERAASSKRAIEAFVCLGTIAAGILTIIAFSYNLQIWKRYPGWLRTIRSSVPSFAIVKETLAQDFPLFLSLYPQSHIASIFNQRLRPDQFFYDDAV